MQDADACHIVALRGRHHHRRYDCGELDLVRHLERRQGQSLCPLDASGGADVVFHHRVEDSLLDAP